jgi:hypothetical protein
VQQGAAAIFTGAGFLNFLWIQERRRDKRKGIPFSSYRSDCQGNPDKDPSFSKANSHPADNDSDKSQFGHNSPLLSLFLPYLSLIMEGISESGRL